MKSKYLAFSVTILSLFISAEFASAKTCTGMGKLIEDGKKKTDVFVVAQVNDRRDSYGFKQGTELDVFIQRTSKPIRGLLISDLNAFQVASASTKKAKLAVKIAKSNYEYAFTTKNSDVRDSYGSGVTRTLVKDEVVLQINSKEVEGIDNSVEVQTAMINANAGSYSIQASDLACGK